MATSPREELRIRTVTVFELDGQGFWGWETFDPDGTVVNTANDLGDSLGAAVDGFFEQIGYNPAIVHEDDTKAHYSEPIFVNEHRYHIREYVHGAPVPFPVPDA